MMKVRCKSCSKKTEFLEFTEEITCEYCNKTHRYKKEDIRYTVGNTLTVKYKIFNNRKFVNYKNFGFSFVIIIFSSIIALMELEKHWNIMFLIMIISSSLLMLTRNNVVNLESSDPNFKKNTKFRK